MELNEVQLGGLCLSPVNGNCLALLPKESSENQTASAASPVQKVIVGDNTGRVLCFAAKNPNVEIIWKVELNAPITCICMGGANNVRDKIFVASGSSVAGINRKGKQFFSFDTNLTEKIGRIRVDASNLYVVAGHIFAHYVEAVEKSFYVSPGVINDFTVLCLKDSEDKNSILACQDRCFRVLSGSKVLFEVVLESIPTVILPVRSEDGRFIYGTNDGLVTQICLSSDATIITDWNTAKPRDSRRITAIHCTTSCKNNQMVCYISRESGVLDVGSLRNGRLEISGSFAGSEAITGVTCGSIWPNSQNNNGGSDSILFSTFSGRICTLESRISFKPSDMQSQIALLKSECEQLEKEVAMAKEKMVHLPKPGANFSVPVPKFVLVDSLNYNPTERTYVLSVNSDVPILNIAIQAPFAIEISQDADITVLPPTGDNKYFMKAVYQGNDCLRAELKLHPVEGQTGILVASILIRTNPVLCLSRQYQVKPLASYQRSVVNAKSDNSKIQMNTMRLSGNFSVGEMNSWIGLCLPEIPDKPTTNTEMEYFYRSSFLKTELNCSLKKGIADFQSDSISSLLVLKDFVVKEATMRNRHLDIKVDVNDNASHSLLERIYEKLSYQKILANKMRLIEAINELHTQEPDLSFLASDLADLWSNRNRIDAEFKMQPQISERASIYLTKIMVAYHAAKGKTVNEARLEKLKQLIGNEHTVAELIATVMS